MHSNRNSPGPTACQRLVGTQKHTKTRHFSTCPPFDRAKTQTNTTLFDISPHSTEQKHTQTRHFSTFPPFRPSKNTQKQYTFQHFPLRLSKNTRKQRYLRHVLPSTMQTQTKTLLFTTCPPFDHAKTHRNTAMYYTSPLRHHENTAIYDTSLHLPPSTKQKHTKPLLFTTLRPFDTTETH